MNEQGWNLFALRSIKLQNEHSYTIVAYRLRKLKVFIKSKQSIDNFHHIILTFLPRSSVDECTHAESSSSSKLIRLPLPWLEVGDGGL